MYEETIDEYIGLLARHLPDFPVTEARLLPTSGQFNTILCVDETWIFRFHKSPHAAADLERELTLLPRLAGKLPLPIPMPEYSGRDPATGQLLFMGYALLPGEPLLRLKFATLRDDELAIERVAADLADFLRALHEVPPDTVGLEASGDDARQEWTRIFEAIREQLFPHMRAEARRTVARHFADALGDRDLWRYDACLIHGDFGTGNLLFAEGRISGVIDFGFCGSGDPAQDLGALLASYGEAFVARLIRQYPALGDHRPRARFYRGNYALIQALYALRDGDQENFEDGIAEYRWGNSDFHVTSAGIHADVGQHRRSRSNPMKTTML